MIQERGAIASAHVNSFARLPIQKRMTASVASRVSGMSSRPVRILQRSLLRNSHPNVIGNTVYVCAGSSVSESPDCTQRGCRKAMTLVGFYAGYLQFYLEDFVNTCR